MHCDLNKPKWHGVILTNIFNQFNRITDIQFHLAISFNLILTRLLSFSMTGVGPW